MKEDDSIGLFIIILNIVFKTSFCLKVLNFKIIFIYYERKIIMKINKKIISLISVIAIMISSSLLMINASSGTNYTKNSNTEIITQNDINEAFKSEDLNFLLENFYSAPERLGLTNNQVENAYIGESFSLAILNSNNSAEICGSVKCFPIYYENDMIAILKITKSNGIISYSIGQSYAPEIQNALDQSSNGIALFVDENDSLYSIDNNNIKKLINSGLDLNNLNAMTFSSESPNSKLTYNALNLTDNVISKNIRIC